MIKVWGSYFLASPFYLPNHRILIFYLIFLLEGKIYNCYYRFVQNFYQVKRTLW
jgi:hypothetical protein